MDMLIVEQAELLSELKRWHEAGSSLHRLMTIIKTGNQMCVAIPRYVDGQLISSGISHAKYKTAYAEFGCLIDKAK